MTSEPHWAVALIVSWLPLILLVGCVWWHARSIRRSLTTPDGRSLAQVVENLARELKRPNDARAG
jgi:hypothetical protein